MMLDRNHCLLKMIYICLRQLKTIAIKAKIVAKQSRDDKLQCVNYLRSEALSDIYGWRCRRVIESDSLHRWWPSLVNIQIKTE